MKINVKQVPSEYKVSLWWFSPYHTGIAGIAEWEQING
jgi:hypothetical protein